MFKKSVKNKDKLIPEGYENRLRSLLDSLPDEVPVSDTAEAEVIKRPVRFDIRPFVSAAAVFAVAAVGISALSNHAGNAFDSGHEPVKPYATASVSETVSETAAVTTVSETVSVSVTEETTVLETESAAVAYTENIKYENEPASDIRIPEQSRDDKPESPAEPAVPDAPDVPPLPEPPSPPVPESPSAPDEPEHPENHEHPEAPEAGRPVRPEVPAGPKNEENKKENEKIKAEKKEEKEDKELFSDITEFAPRPVPPCEEHPEK